MLPIQGRDIQCIGTCLVEVMRVETGWGHGAGSCVECFRAQVSRVDLAYTFSGQEGRFPAIGPCHRLKVNAEAKMGWAVGRAVCTSPLWSPTGSHNRWQFTMPSGTSRSYLLPCHMVILPALLEAMPTSTRGVSLRQCRCLTALQVLISDFPHGETGLSI